MLGKLFSTAASSLTPRAGNTPNPSRPTTSLESVQEDIHTRNLLFPDTDTLFKHHHDQVFPLSSAAAHSAVAQAFDLNPDSELEMKDVRVIIMQDSSSISQTPTLLFDSCPLREPVQDRPPQTTATMHAPPRRGSRASICTGRKGSLGQISSPVVITQESAAPRTFGAFDRKTAALHRGASLVETDGQRSAREYREEMTTFSNCIFGSSDILAYKGVGTKMHVVPTDAKPPPSTVFTDGLGSFGRASVRGSKLAQSTTFEGGNMGLPSGLPGSAIPPRASERRKVLITRTFPVPLLNDETEEARNATPTPKNMGNDENSGYPFPRVDGQPADPKDPKKRQVKQKRTPMYAVALIIQLPNTPQAIPVSKTGFKGSGSYNEHESCPSSFSSSKWVLPNYGFGVESMDSSFSIDGDDRMETITQHWDIIMRTLSHMQAVATSILLPLLKQADTASPDPPKDKWAHRRATASISVSGKRLEEEVKYSKPWKSTIKSVQLIPNILAHNEKIKVEVDSARWRVVNGIKALQVVTAQGRWGIWREEARWVGKWAGNKEEGFFFFNLLTGFLGNHTEWLRALGPSWYRRRHYQQQRANRDDDIAIPARTIIISNDKMAARRLVFLLSAFLPATSHTTASRVHRPSTAASFGGYSQSPPSFLPVNREASLRRRMNKRGGGVRSSQHNRAMSFPAQVAPEIHHDRRTSDAASIKTANLPIPGSDIGTRKCSAATTATVIPVTTVPHFSTRRSVREVRGTGPLPRPDSSGSLATDDLLRSLKRGDSTGQFSNASSDSQSQQSRWGSMISGFWSGKRRNSTNITDITQPAQSPERDAAQQAKPAEPSPPKSKLAEMVQEAQQLRTQTATNGAAPKDEAPHANEELDRFPTEVQRPPPQPYESPVKTSINALDGSIDIEVPLPDFLSTSVISSPSSSGYLSATTPGLGNGLDGFEHYSRTGADSELPLNVCGWLPSYHADFTLQAIPSPETDRNALIEEIKKSMRAEPTPLLALTPSLDELPKDRWVDISSALIADTTNFSIKRIRYKRLIKASRLNDEARAACTPGLSALLDARSQYGNPYIMAAAANGNLLTPGANDAFGLSAHCEEKFVEEAIVSMDETLIDAVERIMEQSGSPEMASMQASKEGSARGGSAVSSRSTSRKVCPGRERSNSDVLAGLDEHMGKKDAKEAGGVKGAEQAVPLAVPIMPAMLEVPRNECKRMVLGALEEIVREVVEARREDGEAGLDESAVGRESVLREGVRWWLSNVEETA